MRGGRRAAALAILALACLLAAGCSKRSKNPVAALPPQLAPARPAPADAVKLLETAYVTRDTSLYAVLFTKDFHFYFSPNDTAGNRYGAAPWELGDELVSARHLLATGNGVDPPASRISLVDAGLHVSDTADTLDRATHRRISTAVALEIAAETTWHVEGNVDFYVARGDAATIPEAIRSRVRPTDWFIYGWVDRTGPWLGLGPDGPLPVREMTWGQVKALYR